MNWCWEQSKCDGALFLTALIITIAMAWWNWSRRKQMGLLPPGPWGLPIIGNLPSLDRDLHRCLAQLSLKYGPVMKLHLGSRLCVIISSPEAAKQVFKDHDADFAYRDVPATGAIISYGEADMAMAPYGKHWRMMRRVCAAELFGNGFLESLYSLRRNEVRDMVSKIHSEIGTSVDLHERLLVTMFSIITSMMWGNTLSGEEKLRVNTQFRVGVDKMMGLLGEFNISDLFPVLAKFDLQGKVRQMKEVVKSFDPIFKFVVDERNKMNSAGRKAKTDFLEVLLQLIDQGDQSSVRFTNTDMKAIFLDMIIAGVRSTSTNVEWAMAELLKHPEMMKKAQDELHQVVGLNNEVEEAHLTQLPYLEAIVKEVMRLHPVGPLLVPHRSRKSHLVGGYLIPEGCKILVNAWAIHRDPSYWTDPLEFQPERFFNSSVDWNYTGNDFRYIPFGSGRRICVGIPLAVKLVPHLLATLLHSFNWELPQETELDNSEKFGIELSLKIPLSAIPSSRLI